MPSSLHLWATFGESNMAAYGESSPQSAFTFLPPVTQQIASWPERSVMWTEVSLKSAKMWHTPTSFLLQPPEGRG